jgi:hypothetical protein
MTNQPNVPSDPVKAFAYLVSKCSSGLYLDLIEAGKTDTNARNQIIFMFLDFAAGEACRVARREGREPRLEKWTAATADAFARAVKRTANGESSEATSDSSPEGKTP